MSVTGIGLSVGGGGANVVPLSVAENGTYTAEEGTAYSPVTVNVPYKTANFEFRNNNAIPAGLFVKCAVPYMNNGNMFTLVSTTKYSGQAQTIVLGESGHTTTTIVTEGWRFTIISGNAVFSDNDHLRVSITGDCVLSVEPIPNYKSKLAQVTDKSVTELTANDLAKITVIGDNAFSYCMNLTSIEIPSSVTTIGEYAFLYCSGLTSLTIPSSVVSIHQYAFDVCTGLQSIVIPSRVTIIEEGLFWGCRSLTSVSLPNVTTIKNYAFSRCSGLVSVTIEATTPPTLTNVNAFDNTHADLVIYVPAESVEAYKAATNWSTYASKIQAIPNS